MQGHRLNTNEEPAELLGGRRSYGEVERPSRHLDKTDIAEGDLEGEGRGQEVQGQDITVGKNEAEGAGRHGTNEAEGAGHQGRYEAEGTGRQGRDLDVEGRGREVQDQDSGDTDSEGKETEGEEERMHPAEHINGILNNGILEKKTQEDSRRNINTRPHNKEAKHTRYQTDTGEDDLDGEGRGRDVRGQDDAERHEPFVTPARLYYLPANPRLAETHDSSTLVPLTGLARSAPKPLTSSNPLHTPRLSNDQPKDVMNELLVENRLDQYVIRNGHCTTSSPRTGTRPRAQGDGASTSAGARGATTRTKTTPRCTSCLSPRPESTTC